MKKLLLVLVALLCHTIEGVAQSSTASGSLTAAATTCAATTCVQIPITPSANGGAVQLTGTWVGTVTFEGTTQGNTWFSLPVVPIAGGTAVTSATATGTWTFGAAGLVAMRARPSAYTSGQIQVDIAINGGSTNSVNIGSILAPATGPQTAANSDSVTCATDTGCAIKAASGAIASGAIASGAIASGAIASGAIASGAFAAGSLNSAIPDACLYSSKTVAPINISTAATTVLVAASASNKVHICNMFLVAAGADNVALVEDASGSCASPDAGLSGGTTAATGWNLVANQGFTWGSGLATVGKTASTNVNVCLITSAAVQLSGTWSYVLAP